MNAEIRDKIFKLISNEVTYVVADELTGKIEALFPSWRTFSNDCKPDNGKRIVIANSDKEIEGVYAYIDPSKTWYDLNNAYGELSEAKLIEGAYQFFEIP